MRAACLAPPRMLNRASGRLVIDDAPLLLALPPALVAFTRWRRRRSRARELRDKKNK